MAPPREPTQELSLRSDPAGAHCSILQQGTAIASADTPGAARVPRRDVPIEIVCRREGYLEARMTFAAATADDVEAEAGTRPWREPRPAVGYLADFVLQGAMAVFPPVALGVMAIGGASAVDNEGNKRPSARYAYRALPEFILIPATFDSESSRDAFFVTLKARLEANANARLADVDAHCRVWPCTPADPTCPSPVCGHARVLVGEQLEAQLAQVPTLRSQTRIVAPATASEDAGARSGSSNVNAQ